MVVVEEDEIRESQNSKISVKLGGRDELLSSGKMSEDKPNSVEDMLRGSGALEFQKFNANLFKGDVSYKSFSNRS